MGQCYRHAKASSSGILGVIGGLYGGIVTPTEAGEAGAFLAMMIGVVQGKLGVEKLIGSLNDAMITTAQIFFVGMGAVMYTKFLALAGISSLFTDMVGNWALNPVLLVIAISIVSLLSG